MNKDGADSPVPPPGPVLARDASSAGALPIAPVVDSVVADAKEQVDESATLARPSAPALTPPRPMPHARIRPTASFPRVSIAAMAAQRAPAVPAVSLEPDAEDAVTQHRESGAAATLAAKRASDDVTRATPGALFPASAPDIPPDATPPVPRSSDSRKGLTPETKEATSLVQGDVIGGLCRIEERLALSEMSVLYRAFHLQLERMVVVKVLQDAGVENVEAVARFRREARLMSLVTSEHVARVLDVGSHAGCPFIVMERLEGADLAYLLKQVGGRLSLKQACDLVLQICEALAVAHSYGIVHRDLKPANVFVSVRAGGDLRVTIIDFGIAKAFFEQQDAEDQLTKVNGLLGSPRYMAPEQVEPRMEVDERVDIWALGILFQEMLTGERVFAAEGIVPLLMAIVESQPVPLRTHFPDAPDAIVATIAQALEKDATRRLPNALTFAARVAPFAGPDAIQRVANIAGIAAAAVERAAESRPVFSDRATLPPKALSPAEAPPGVPTVAPSAALRAALLSSNPPPTMRLAREAVFVTPAPSAPPVPPPAVVVPPQPVPPVALAGAAFAEPAAALAATPTAANDGNDADTTAAADASDDGTTRRSPMRSPGTLLLAAALVAILAAGSVLLVRHATEAPSAAGLAATADLTASPSTATATAATAATAPAPLATPSASTDPLDTPSADSPEPSAASSVTVPVTSRPQASAAPSSLANRLAPSASAPSSVAPPDPAAAAQPAKPATGTLTVVCLPKCDQILDNGVAIGNGYVFSQEVPVGHHTLSLSTAAGVKKALAVDIVADATKELRVSMDK